MEEVSDRERMQFYSSLRCRREKNLLTSTNATWATWFKKKWGESLAEYAARAKAENIAQRVVATELARFGFSPASSLIEATKSDRRHGRAKALKKKRRSR